MYNTYGSIQKQVVTVLTAVPSRMPAIPSFIARTTDAPGLSRPQQEAYTCHTKTARRPLECLGAFPHPVYIKLNTITSTIPWENTYSLLSHSFINGLSKTTRHMSESVNPEAYEVNAIKMNRFLGILLGPQVAYAGNQGLEYQAIHHIQSICNQ